MTSGVSVKTAGVRPEAMTVAREAARRSGVSLTHWLNSAIIETAGEDTAAQEREGRRPPDRRAPAAAALAELERLRTPEVTAGWRAPALDVEGRTESPAPREDGAAATGDWSADLERAVSEIAARQRALEMAPGRPEKLESAPPQGDSPTSVELERFEQQLRRLTEEIEALRRPGAIDAAVASVQHDLRAVAYTLTDALPSRILAAFQSQIEALAERLGSERLDGRSFVGLEQRLAEVRASLSALPSVERFAGLWEELRALSGQVEELAANQLDADALRPLEAAVADLGRVVSRSGANDALVAVRSDIHALGSRFEPAIAAAPPAIDELSQRIEALTARVEANSAQARREIPDRIETVLRSLSERFEAVRPWGSDAAGFDALEQRIIGLAQKLDAADAGHVAAIEGRMADLIDDLKEAHALALETAQSTTRSITREILAARTAADDEVGALRHDVSALSAAQADIDRRTGGTLEAIHDTLARLLARMATLETEISVPPAVETAGSTFAAPPPNRWPEPATSALTPARRAGDPHPLEPGSGAPRRATPAERIAASEAALAGTTAQAPNAKATFIAAARRAARAAATLEDAPAADPDPEEATSRPDAIASTLAKHRGTLLIAAAGVALLIGTVHFLSGLVGSPEAVRLDALRSIPNAMTALPFDSASAVAPLPDRPSDPVSLSPARRSPVKPDDDALISPLPGPGLERDVVGALAVAPRSEPEPPVAAVAPIAPSDLGPTPSGLLPVAIGGPALRAAAASENPAAEFEVAVRYSEGRGVPQSFETAARWFERGADHGLAPAQFRLGCFYEKGQGVKKDLETARRLYLSAADRGHAKAMHNLAVLYAEGIDGKPDYKTASQWFRKAADHGVPDSQFNLGILYARGIGVEQNLPESYKWFSLAAQQGDQDAAKKRDEVAARLDPQALVAARLAAQTFTADPQPEDAITVATPPGGWDRPLPARPKASIPGRMGATPPAPDRG
jgi:localization factor PodJL